MVGGTGVMSWTSSREQASTRTRHFTVERLIPNARERKGLLDCARRCRRALRIETPAGNLQACHSPRLCDLLLLRFITNEASRLSSLTSTRLVFPPTSTFPLLFPLFFPESSLQLLMLLFGRHLSISLSTSCHLPLPSLFVHTPPSANTILPPSPRSLAPQSPVFQGTREHESKTT
jgi:hypothetical protein